MTEKEVQREAVTYLKAHAWNYWFPPRTWGERDIFGVFDFIAVIGKKVIFVQLTTLQHISDREKKILKFFNEQKVAIPNCYVWAWDKRKLTFVVRKVGNIIFQSGQAVGTGVAPTASGGPDTPAPTKE